MCKIIIILFLLLFFSGRLSADTWSKTDKILAGTFIAASAIDYLQTTSNLKHGGYEIFGIKNSTEATFIMGGLVTVFLLIANNNPKMRTAMLIGGNAAEWGIVAYNNGIGIRVSF